MKKIPYIIAIYHNDWGYMRSKVEIIEKYDTYDDMINCVIETTSNLMASQSLAYKSYDDFVEEYSSLLAFPNEAIEVKYFDNLWYDLKLDDQMIEKIYAMYQNIVTSKRPVDHKLLINLSGSYSF